MRQLRIQLHVFAPFFSGQKVFEGLKLGVKKQSMRRFYEMASGTSDLSWPLLRASYEQGPNEFGKSRSLFYHIRQVATRVTKMVLVGAFGTLVLVLGGQRWYQSKER